MNYFDLQSSYPGRTIAGPWDAQTQNVDKTPAFANPLSQHESELNAPVAAGYAELRALPVARVVLCNVSLLVPANCRRSRRSACGTADEDYSIGWRGPWPAPPYGRTDTSGNVPDHGASQ